MNRIGNTGWSTKKRPAGERFWEKVKKTDGCWEWTGAKRDFGYGQFSFQGRPIKSHRLAWILTYGEIPAGMCICHKCDNPICVRPSHLFVGTRSDNANDSVRKGRWNRPRGENQPNAKLSERDVNKIRKLWGKKTSLELSAMFNIDRSHIYKIKNRRYWTHI